ncbi:hypothetical protein EAH68_01515 [Corynebacterium hylobatis]|uniref:ABC-type glycine betaine transport system substrate-binding domain-containing protein n=1 Tax=Corynebacterium hylobatis TaxID=1859290 RepID=A0A3S0HIU6_9CORY|nr:hypothetical protein [Corynebacterium hylobatis]RSZ65465.1 hypothetical protein EAH68_01515 [Corynebacterium hylobatis]
MNRLLTRAALPALGLVGLLSLSACTAAEPGRDPNPNHTKAVEISVSANSPEQLILGEVYAQTLQELGRSTNLSIVDTPHATSRLDRLRSGETDMIIGCTGVFLHTLDPVRAEELAGEIAADEVEDPFDEAYREFIGALPGNIISPDPSSAQACAEEAREKQAPDLPRSVVPVYKRELFDRTELVELTAVTRLLTTEDIATLVDSAAEESSASRAVAAWLG